MVSKPIIQYYYTQMVGDARALPVLKAASGFKGMAVVDSDPYTDSGSNWYTNQNNFLRAIRNLVIDLTAMPPSSGAGIHWQVAQATSLQNIRFEMAKGGGESNKQQGIFMDNGSGGFMSDLVFNGGNYGAFLGNQQFTTRNLTFNDCNTAIFMNWNWAWTFKSVNINNCAVGLNMSNSPQNQTVGSIMLLDSKLTNTPTGVVTAFTHDSRPVGGGVLVLDNVDFTGSKTAVAGVKGDTVLAGGSVVSNWMQGQEYASSDDTKSKRSEPGDSDVPEGYKKIQVVKTLGYCPAPSPAPQALSSVTSTPTLPATSSTDGFVPLSTGFSSPNTLHFTSSTVDGASPTTSVRSVSSLPTSSSTEAPLTTSTPSSSLTTATPTSSVATQASGTCPSKPIANSRVQRALPSQAKPSPLLDTSGRVFERSKPLYEDYAASSFVSVKSAGAKGDGSTDDTAAIQKVLDSAKEGQIVYFDHGAYIITSTIKVPKNIKITGEVWPLLMASGPAFGDQSRPVPLLQIGQKGDTGSVELSDLILETKGPAPGAILMEWNVAETTQGSAGMWDVHFRVGGTAGTELQSDTCAKDPGGDNSKPNPKCVGAFMMLHVTDQASAYIENSWVWTADHELDQPGQTQVSIYTGRGVLIEGNGPVWLYGTASEHHQLYNYQVANARNVFMGMIQAETPYYQSNPSSLRPFTPQKQGWNDPDFSSCTTDTCRKSWGLRVVDSSDLYIYGAGLYSFFDNYGQKCLDSESCQENMVEVDGCSDVHLFGLSTKASSNMISSAAGKSLVPQGDNKSTFCSTIGLFRQVS